MISKIQRATRKALKAIIGTSYEPSPVEPDIKILHETIREFTASEVQKELLEILSSKTKRVISDRALRILDVEFPNLLERLPKWSLCIVQPSAASFLIERGYLDRAAPLTTEYDGGCKLSYYLVLGPEANLGTEAIIRGLTPEQLDLWNIQKFIETLEADEEFEEEQTAFCYFEEFINLVDLAVVTKISRESYDQLHTFYKGLEDDIDNRGRDARQLKQTMRSLKAKVH
jgi:hypothetical protein